MKKQRSKKNRSVITRRIVQSVRRLTMTVFTLIVFAGMTQIGGTNAGFSDVEESTGNVLTATSLDGEATYIEYFSVVGMKPVQSPDSRITFSNVGALDFRYGIKYRQTGGDSALCDAFLLTAERNGTEVYTGLLKDFDMDEYSGNPFALDSLYDDQWDFTAELPLDAGNALENKTCQWHFDFTAWQTDMPDATGGFSDTETVGPHSIATGEWLTPGDVIINEVMWMGSTGDSDDEWIELKNMTAYDINLSNWDIENGGSGAGHIEIPNGYSIKANGYFLITKKKWDETAISLTSDLAHDKGYTHVSGMSLLNSGEQLTLEDKDNNVIDLTPVDVWPAGNHGSGTPFEQSMERNDIPGDGLLASSWHTCVSGVCNDGTYWDTADGNNFGTPLSANLSPIVMNEFVFNPEGDDDAVRPDGEWIELYNILDEDIDVSGWYFTNADGDKIVISAANTQSGETLVPGNGTLVVYLEQAFLDNDADTLSLYAPVSLLEDDSDDVREDTYSYADAAALPEGKSFARFPDGEGIWIDPEATPGEENVMNEEDRRAFRRLTYDACFAGEKLQKGNTEEVCSPIFLAYIGMLDAPDDDTILDSALLDVLEMIRAEEEQKLLALLEEIAIANGTAPAADTPEEESDTAETADEEEGTGEETEETADEPVLTEEEAPAAEENASTEEVVPSEDPTPVETAMPEEEVIAPPEEPSVEEAPADEAVPAEETPAVAPEETPIIESPIN